MKKILIITALLALSLCLFVSCAQNDGAVTDENGGQGAEDAPEPDAVFSVDELLKYVAVRSDDAASEEKTIFVDFVAKLKSALGSRIESQTDFVFANKQPPELEVLFGETVRDESAEIYSSLKYNDYVIAVKGTKIVIAGGSEESLSLAADKFLSFIKDGKLTIPASKFEYNAEYKYPELKLDGVGISEYNLNDLIKISSQIENLCY